jgi:hydrogenase expression/formation protein HypC
MCLAVPGKVLSIEGEDPAFRSALVDFCGVRKVVSLSFTPEVQLSDYVLVHVGFAISRIDEEEAHRTFEYLKHIGALTEEGLTTPLPGEEEPPGAYAEGSAAP